MNRNEDVTEREDFVLDMLGKKIVGSKGLAIGFYRNKEESERITDYLDELEELASSCSIDIIHRKIYSIKKIESSTYLSKGKLEEILHFIKDNPVSVLVIDEEISASQQRNLEKYFNLPVIDRTELILEIFSLRASTSEARLQIELAKARYMFPRLKRLWGHLSRQSSGGGGFLKGEGEKQIELDRRMLKDRIFKLKIRLKEAIASRRISRKCSERRGIPTFAVIGYTNSGKSTLLNRLTDAGVYCEDKLFATLSTKTKKLILPNKMTVLITDTVGFIRKLPHTLVAAFRSTLEAAFQNDVLLHVIDTSHPMAEEHIATTYGLLKELDIKTSKIITVLNKTDICSNDRILSKLRFSCPQAVLFSALTGEGLDDLLAAMERATAIDREKMILQIPCENYACVAELLERGLVVSQSYDEDGNLIVESLIPKELMKKFLPYKKECS